MRSATPRNFRSAQSHAEADDDDGGRALSSVGEAVHAVVLTAEGKSRPTTPAAVAWAVAGATALSQSSSDRGGALASLASPTIMALTQDDIGSPGSVARPTADAADADFDAAFAVLNNNSVVTDMPGLQKLLDEKGYVRELMDTWDEEDVEAIGSFLKQSGKKAFEKKLRAAQVRRASV